MLIPLAVALERTRDSIVLMSRAMLGLLLDCEPLLCILSLFTGTVVRQKPGARLANQLLLTTLAIGVMCFALGCGGGDPRSDAKQPVFTNASLKGNYICI